ncbi:hypothetical protein OAP83_03065 [Rickettsiales bacterium]|nr:hypothetical protein [Rickettsiales bacterium]
MSYQAFNDFFIKQDASKLTDGQKKLHDLAGVFFKDKLENSSKELIDTEQSKQINKPIKTGAWIDVFLWIFIIFCVGPILGATAVGSTPAAIMLGVVAGLFGLLALALPALSIYDSMKSQDVQKQTEQVKSQDLQKQTLEVLEGFNIRTKWAKAVTDKKIVDTIAQNIEKAKEAITEAKSPQQLNDFAIAVIEFAQANNGVGNAGKEKWQEFCNANDGMTGELYSFENAAKFSKAYQDTAKESGIHTGRVENLRQDKKITEIGARLKRIPESLNEEISTKLNEQSRSI